MAKQRKLEEIRTVYYCSSSISNFKEKIARWSGLEEWSYSKLFRPVIFFGLYHWKDYLRFILHRGPKKVFWCGADILHLGQAFFGPFTKSLLVKWVKAKHYCENEVERRELSWYGIYAEIRPVYFGEIPAISFKPTDHPVLFLTYHRGREEEYGFQYSLYSPYIDSLIGLDEDGFNELVKHYQGAIRFNRFDGFAETLAKSILMGQYPISFIRYPHIACLRDISLEEHIEQLKIKTEPNVEGREYWLEVLEENRKELCEHW
jgi:hypothetical protein